MTQTVEPDDTPIPHTQVAIIGTGFGGIAAAARLRRAGITDMVLLERAGEVGGVWRDNDYPGAAVDVQSALYSFSFAPNPHWRSTFAKQPELAAYLTEVSQTEGLRADLVLNCEVRRLEWDDTEKLWWLETARGPRTARHVVVATGVLADPVIPELPGADSFTGVSFHSARWNHDFDVRGKRIAVVGTGPSAVQFVPAIQPEARHLTVFQRTPAWVVPRHDHEIGAFSRALYRRVPLSRNSNGCAST
ncbi:flavin-containing monooxygenase [Nocardia asteroides]|uniref:flavin-containing monooxygenase n=1 Tax=Nocardia asteroides TaxID=1824 RepID=UPI0037A42A18